VPQAVGQGVFAGETASVIRCGVGSVALHAPTANATEQQAAQSVGVLGAVWLVRALDAPPGGQEFLGPLEGLVIDDRRVDDLLGVDPLVLVVPGRVRVVGGRAVPLSGQNVVQVITNAARCAWSDDRHGELDPSTPLPDFLKRIPI
jgi:hypothetical protein